MLTSWQVLSTSAKTRVQIPGGKTKPTGKIWRGAIPSLGRHVKNVQKLSWGFSKWVSYFERTLLLRLKRETTSTIVTITMKFVLLLIH